MVWCRHDAHRDEEQNNPCLFPKNCLMACVFVLTPALCRLGATPSQRGVKVIDAIGPAGPTGTSYAGRPADLWSLGVTLYTMLAGYLPFEAESENAVVEKIQVTQLRVR